VSACLSELDRSRPHISLPLATAVGCPEINLILHMKSQPLQAPARTRSSCNPQHSSTSPKIEKSARDQSNPARNPFHHTYPVELAVISVWLSPNDLPFAELRLHGVGYAVPILAALAILPQQRPARGSSEQPSITRSILPICNDRGSSSFRARMTCLLTVFHVSLPPCDPFSQCRRFVFGP